LIDSGDIAARIRWARGQRVLLDSDLAALYGVTTKAFNQAVRRNIDRFPADFLLQLTDDEAGSLRSQIVTLKTGRGQHRKYPPLAFTEHGFLMLSNVLRSARATEVSVLIVRAFVQLRGAMAASRELAERVDALSVMLQRQGRKLATHEHAILKLLAEIRRLTQFPESPSKPIGFTANIRSDDPP
jgi:phage regulator Rha-like protein